MKVEDLLFNEQFNAYYHNWSPETQQRFEVVLEKVGEVCGEYDAWFANTTKDLRCGCRREENKKGKNVFTFFFSQNKFGMWISRRGLLADDGGPYLKSGEENNYHEFKNLESEDQLNFVLSNLKNKVTRARKEGFLPRDRTGRCPDTYRVRNNELTMREQLIEVFSKLKGETFKPAEITEKVNEYYGTNISSAYPKDHCYNSYNISHGIDEGKLVRQALFEFIGGNYKYLGENADYSGDITWNPKGKTNSAKIVGRWKNGVITDWLVIGVKDKVPQLKNETDVNSNDDADICPMLATNRIYFGPPGTGKTHILQTEVLAQYQDDGEGKQRYRFVTFHPSYSYEEFVEGIRAETNDEGQISYAVKSGIFRDLCKQAQEDPDHRYALIIDEINRGNMAKILGELITLIEPDKRLGAEHELAVTLPYSGDTFGVPQNLDIYGTMNTADRSLALMDNALRRRFEFKEMLAAPYLLSYHANQAVPLTYRNAVAAKALQEHADDLTVQGINLRLLLTVINLRIERIFDRDHTLGHAFFLPVKKALALGEEQAFTVLQDVFANKIIPLLEEYFFEDWDKIRKVLADDQKSAAVLQFIQTEDEADLPGYDVLFIGDAPRRGLTSYQKNADALAEISAYQEIYLSACKIFREVAA